MKKILTMQELADKTAVELGFKNQADLHEKTKQPTNFEGIPHITYSELDLKKKHEKKKGDNI